MCIDVMCRQNKEFFNAKEFSTLTCVVTKNYTNATYTSGENELFGTGGLFVVPNSSESVVK